MNSTGAMRIPWKTMPFWVLAMVLAGGVPGYAGPIYFAGTAIPIPTGLAAGDTFQMVFVTSESYAATSTSIGDYNADVTASANEAASLVNGLGITWSVLGSTASTNVLQNIVNTSPGTPGFSGIFDLAGNMIADGTETTGNGLFSGTILNRLDYDEYGSVGAVTLVWTGTTHNGTSQPGVTLGNSTMIYGDTLRVDPGWIEESSLPSTFSLPLYGISNLLELGPGDTLEVTPEPETIGITLLGLAACYLASYRKRVVAPSKTKADAAPTPVDYPAPNV